jgi:hypothetical protein
MEPTISDKEVIDVMRDGGLRVVDYAKEQWMSPTKYPDFTADERRQHIDRWNQIGMRIREMAKELKRK